jgi:outer membrane receptor for ferrienterochelin and colicin
VWNAASPLEVGWSMREIRDQGFANQYQSVVTSPLILDRYNGNALRLGGYAQQSWTGLAGRLHLTAGGRWDDQSLNRIQAVSPTAAASYGVTASTTLQLGFGQYVQYPEVSVLTSVLGRHSLLPERSNQATGAMEQRIGERTRIRAEYYDRTDRDLIFQPLADPRILNGKVFSPPRNPPYTNSVRGWARGGQIFLQHTTANRLTGWVSYAYGRALEHDGVTGQGFPSDYDQRHTVNAYGGYRLRPSINLSMRWSYGSGFPIPGYLVRVGTQYDLWVSRNQLRLSPYSRLDFRINKAWTHNKWKLTLYGEVLNLLNRTNYVFDSFNGFNSTTHAASVTLDRMAPVLPAAGLTFER